MAKTFTAVIEESPRMELDIQWASDPVPMFIEFPDGSVLANMGKYASPGERYRFRRVIPVKIAETAFSISPALTRS